MSKPKPVMSLKDTTTDTPCDATETLEKDKQGQKVCTLSEATPAPISKKEAPQVLLPVFGPASLEEDILPLDMFHPSSCMMSSDPDTCEPQPPLPGTIAFKLPATGATPSRSSGARVMDAPHVEVYERTWTQRIQAQNLLGPSTGHSRILEQPPRVS